MTKRKKKKKKVRVKLKVKKKSISNLKKSKKKDNSRNTTELIYKVKNDWVKKALINKPGYEKKYKTLSFHL